MNAVYTNTNFQNIILTALAIVVLVVLLWSLYTFVRAIILFVFSHAKEENKKKWWNSIRFMIIGIILTIVLLFLVPVVLKWMRVPAYDVYTTKNVFSKVWDLIRWAFDLWDIIQQSQQNSEYRGDFYYKLDSSPQTSPQNDYSL